MIDLDIGLSNFIDEENDEILFEMFEGGTRPLPSTLIFDPKGLKLKGFIEPSVMNLSLFFY